MKNTFLKTKLCLMGLCAVFALSCSPEDGEDGVIGPQGIQGPQGIPGQNGATGSQGPAGTANIMYSDWINQDWNFADGATFKSMMIEDVNITDSFLANGGIVLGFFRFQKSSTDLLPYQNFTSNNIRTFVALHFTDGGQVRFNIISTDRTDLTANELNGGGGEKPQYKYVLIPGGINISGKSQQPDFKKMSYEELMDYFGLE